jgi:hypothetical protein
MSDICGNLDVVLLQLQLLLTSTSDDSFDIAAEGRSVGRLDAARLQSTALPFLLAHLLMPVLAVGTKGFDWCHPSGSGCTLLYGQLSPHGVRGQERAYLALIGLAKQLMGCITDTLR